MHDIVFKIKNKIENNHIISVALHPDPRARYYHLQRNTLDRTVYNKVHLQARGWYASEIYNAEFP